MQEHDESVDLYAMGTAVFPVFFPHGKADCRHCRFCRYSEPFALFRCSLTDAYMDKAELNYRHRTVPIQFEETEV